MDSMGTFEQKPAIDAMDEKEVVEHLESTQQLHGSNHLFEEMGHLKTARVFWKSVLICAMVSVGAIFDAYAVTVPGSIIANEGFIAVFGTVETATGLALDANYVAAWGGVQSAGQILGMITGPFTSDIFGRKFNMYLLTAILIVAIVLEITAKTWTVYLVARLFAGWATGLVQSGLTVYIAEVAPTKIRGACLAGYSFFFGVGQLAASIGLQIIVTTQPTKYKLAFYSEFVLVGAFLPALLLAPESPWFYVRRGKEGKARKSLQTLYGSIEGYDIDHQYEIIAATIRQERALHFGNHFTEFLDCFRGVNLRRTLVSWIPLAFTQFVGIALIFGYSTYFFQLAGFPKPFEASLIISFILLLFILISFFVVDKFGRRPLLLSGGVIMGCCTMAIGGIGFKSTLPGGALVALCAIWVAAYAISAGPLSWAYVADTSTPRLRAKTTGLAAAGSCVFGLIFNYTTPIMLSPQKANWGVKSGLFWGGLSFCGLIVIYFVVPEISGRTYEELDEMFEKRIPTRKFKEYICEVQVARNANNTDA